MMNDATRVRERTVDAPEHMEQHSLKRISAEEKFVGIKSTSLPNPKNPTGIAKSASPLSRVEPKNIKRVEARDARFDKTDLDSSPSELAANASIDSDTQAAMSLSTDKPAPAGDSAESNTPKDASQAKLPLLAHQQKTINPFSHAALLVAGLPENDFLDAAKKPANSRQGAESQLETAPSIEMLRAKPVAALLLGDGSTASSKALR